MSIDFNPNYIWQSDGRTTDEGWTAELRIPLISLRFRELPVQDWGIQVAREIRRNGYKQAWAPLTQDVSSTLSQSGRLVGLTGLRSRRLAELNPVLTGARTGDSESGSFRRSDPSADFGMNGKVALTQNLVMEGTYNPDFSQVEADAGQIAVNERFALFFPEKRAFFLEGGEIFSTPARLVHTRQIADPVAGSKVIGKVGSFQVGWLGAVDESPSSLAGEAGHAVFNLARVRRDVGAASTVGLLFTDRTRTDGSGAYNRVLAGDARLVFAGRYTVTGQAAGSLTRGAGDAGHSGLEPFLHLDVQRSGRTLSWNANVTDVAPGFRTRSGFVTRAGDTEANATLSFTRFGAPGALVESRTLRVIANNFFRHDEFWRGGSPFEYEMEVWPTLSFRGSRSLTLVLRRGYFRFEEGDYEGYAVQGDGGEVLPFTVPPPLSAMNAWGLIPRARVNNALSLNGSLFVREVPIFAEARRGHEVRVSPELQYRPTTQLQLQFNYTYSRISRRASETETVTLASPGFVRPAPAVTFPRQVTRDTPFSTVHIPRARIQYQFSKALFARVVAQYELSERAALADPASGRPLLVGGAPSPAQSSGELQGQFLVQYEPSPGTVVYLGYSRLMEGRRTLRIEEMEPVSEGLFVKLSYVFRR